MSTNALQSIFEKVGKEINCEDCRVALRARIQEVCWQWSGVKVRAFSMIPHDACTADPSDCCFCRGRSKTEIDRERNERTRIH